MEMPQSCKKCISTNCIWGKNGSDYLDVIVALQDFRRANNDGFPDFCPILCQLPEGHGRLVDADAYSAEMKDRQDAAWKWAEQAKVEEDEVKQARAEGAFTAFVEAKLTWDEQATIVPAGRSET
jgi:hypothetical protein